MRGTEAGMMLLAGASVVRKWLIPESRMAHHLMVAASVVMVLRRTEAASA
jgi:hypothetical protein